MPLSLIAVATKSRPSSDKTISFFKYCYSPAICQRRSRRRIQANGRSHASTGQGADAPTTRYAHNALGQRVFKTEALYNTSSDAWDEGGEEQETSFLQSIANFFVRLWSPKNSEAEHLGWAYLYDEEGSLVGEYGMGGASSGGQGQYFYLPTASGPMPIAAEIDGLLYAIHSDHLNTPRHLTQQGGQPAWQWAYSAYGDETPTLSSRRFTNETTNPTTGSTGIPPVRFNLRYPGQYFDEETGLHYNYFRSYDPRVGRYTQGDPIGLEGGFNRYAYAEADSINWSDPFGLKTMQCTKPLNALGPKWGPVGYKYGPMLYHQYSCVTDKNGKTTCGGQDRGENGEGKPSKDIPNPDGGQCKETQPDNNCYEQCLMKEWAKPRPKYGIPFGTDCQEYDDNINAYCRKQCNIKNRS